MIQLILLNLIAVILIFILSSCGDKTLQSIGLKKEEIDAFTVSRKQALDMPPDMVLRPPGKEKKIFNNKVNNKENKNISNKSLDEILLDLPSNNKGKKIVSKTKSNLKSNKNIVYKILKTKANMVLK